MTLFTDREAAVEELEFLVEQTSRAHAIVSDGDGRRNRWRVVPVTQLNGREPLVTMTPEVS